MPDKDDERHLVDDPYDPPKVTKKYRVFAIHNGQPHGGPIGEYETLGQLRKHKQRLDRVEAVVQRKKDDGIVVIPIRQFLESKKVERDDA